MKEVALLTLGIALLVLFFWLWKGPSTEGFLGEVEQAIKDTLSPLAKSINPLDNPIAPIGINAGTAQEIRDTVDKAINPPVVVPAADGGFDLKDPTTRYAPRIDDENSFLGRVKYCETVGKTQNPFSDPKFNEHCGMCITSGESILKTKFNEPTGVYVRKEEKRKALDDMKKNGRVFPRITPSNSSATCMGASRGDDAQPVLALTGEQYVSFKNRIQCRKTKQVGNGCAQCFTNNEFSSISNPESTEALTLYLYGSGNATVQTITKKGTKTIGKEKQPLQRNQASVFELERLMEGNVFTLTVEKGATADGPYVSGFFQAGIPNGGIFQMPLDKLSLGDEVTGSAARRVGSLYSVDAGVKLIILRAGSGQERMKLNGTLPFTFLEKDELATFDCSTGPFMSLPESAAAFSKDSCTGQAPGGYSEACLREKVLEAGCDVNGQAYKQPLVEAGTNSIAQFIDKIINYANMKDVDREAARRCVGITETTPCDAILEKKGYSDGQLNSCLAYLYSNESEASSIGRAYPGTTMAYTSVNAKTKKPAFCSPRGSLNPETNPNELKGIFTNGYKGQKGIEAVKIYLSEVFQIATNDGLSPTQPDSKGGRMTSIGKCFGPVAAFPTGGMSGLPEVKRLYSLPWATASVHVLGNIGMEPWRSAWGVSFPGFPDPNAKWIWANPGAAQNEPSWQEYTFYGFFQNTGDATINATGVFAIDNVGTVYLNGRFLGSITTIGTLQFQLPPGESMLEVRAANRGGPAGFIVAVRDTASQAPLFRTDQSWRMRV